MVRRRAGWYKASKVVRGEQGGLLCLLFSFVFPCFLLSFSVYLPSPFVYLPFTSRFFLPISRLLPASYRLPPVYFPPSSCLPFVYLSSTSCLSPVYLPSIFCLPPAFFRLPLVYLPSTFRFTSAAKLLKASQLSAERNMALMRSSMDATGPIWLPEIHGPLPTQHTQRGCVRPSPPGHRHNDYRSDFHVSVYETDKFRNCHAPTTIV